MAKEKDYFGKKILTPEFRASFVNVFEVDKNDKYSIVMMFPKDTDLSELKAEVKRVALNYFKVDSVKDLPGYPSKFRMPFKDGDKPNEEGKIREEQKGHIIVNAWTGKKGGKPGLVDENVNEIIDQREFYSGCYARATITPFAYNRDGNRGMSLFLSNVQKLRDGEPFGANSNPKNDFTAVEPTNTNTNAANDDDNFLT